MRKPERDPEKARERPIERDRETAEPNPQNKIMSPLLDERSCTFVYLVKPSTLAVSTNVSLIGTATANIKTVAQRKNHKRRKERKQHKTVEP